MEFEGVIRSIRFRSEETGFTVANIDTEDGSISIVGKSHYIKIGDRVRLEGELNYHDLYGEQVSFTSIEIIRPTSEGEVVDYLSSGIIPFIGKKTAKKIVDLLGEGALDIIEEDPEVLLKIKGIGKKRLPLIIRALEEEKFIRETLFFFQKYGIPPSISIKLHKKYGDLTIEYVKENPYSLIDEVHSIGFKRADSIALSLGVEKNSYQRIEAGFRYVLKNAYQQGHSYLEKDILLKATNKLLGINESLEDAFKDFVVKNYDIAISQDGEDYNVYLKYLLEAENYCASKLIKLSKESGTSDDSFEDIITQLEEEMGIDFAHKQKLAVINSIKNGVSVITGGPGTGKTTVINAIIRISMDLGLKVKLAAPTGRAAKRMTEATGHPAETIHRLLEFSFGDEESGSGFNRDEDNPLEADMVIIDECSMLDILLARSLLKAVPLGTKLIFVGDRDQLPSVGAGNVLADIIDSGVVSVTILDEIFRQSKESMIVANAHRINRGEEPILNEKDMDFYFLHRETEEGIQRTIVELLSGRLTNYYGIESSDIQALTPMRKGVSGVNNLNKKLQEALNPPTGDKEETRQGDDIFRVGDKVMQIKNNYNLQYKIIKDGFVVGKGEGVYNGDIGFIQEIEEGIVKVLFDNERLVDYEFLNLDELTLSYATTIHKSQGSEFPAIVMAMGFAPPILANRNLLYTAITRAKKLVVLVGDEKNLKRMINNTDNRKRNSKLDEKMRFFLKTWNEFLII